MSVVAPIVHNAPTTGPSPPTEYDVFVDESGEFGQKSGSSKFFLIAALSTANKKALNKRIKKEKAILYNDGWPGDIEIKGTSLWGSHHNSRIPQRISANRIDILKRIITSIVLSPVKVHYSIARKERLAPHIRSAPYGVAYNWLAGKLLTRAYPEHFSGPLNLIVDQRNKETHSKMKFDGYVETQLVCECSHTHHLAIEHAESHAIPGLQAVDFLSWGLFRYYEHDDNTFRPLILPALGYRDAWYPGK